MTVYWIVWISILLISLCVQAYDYIIDGALTEKRVFHIGTAKFFYIIGALILIFAAGCRFRVGADFGAYYRYYNYLDLADSLKTLDEPGIRLVYTIASHIHSSGQFCIFFVASITLGLQLMVIYKNTDKIGLALILFTFIGWTACFNGVRQSLAVAVLFCGYPALRDRDFKLFALYVTLAYLCHRSAAVMILIYFISDREVNASNFFFLIIASIIVLFSYDRVFQAMNFLLDHDINGTETYWSTTVNRLRPLSKVVAASYFLFVYRGISKTRIMNIYLNLIIIEAVVAVATMNSAALSRMSLYTAPFTVLAITELTKGINEKNQRIMTMLIVILYWVFAWFECNGVMFTLYQLRWIW